MNQVVQSRETVNILRSKYQPEQLYMVTGRCEIRDPMDLAANSGLIVSVVKREDPMGNTGRWFVDAGGKIILIITGKYITSCLTNKLIPFYVSSTSEVRGFLPAKHLNLFSPPASTNLRPESTTSVASSVVSVTSCNSSSLEKLYFDEEEEPSSTNGENVYDLPPSYEEALGNEEAQSPHRYCEIDDLVDESNSKEMNAAYYSPDEKAESPIYAIIEDIIPSRESKEKLSSTENNVRNHFEST